MQTAYHAALAGLVVVVPCALGQAYDFTITPAGPTPSSMNATFEGAATFTGTLTGNYNQTTNPSGTRVLNFDIFGNRPPAPMNLTKTLSGNGGADGNAVGRPVGTYSLQVHDASVTISGLSTDLVGSAMQTPTPVGTTITYQSFLTAAPNNSYPFLVAIPVDIGEASVSRVEIAQTEDATGSINSGANGTFTFSIQVPVEVTAAVDFQGNDVTQVSAQTITVNGSITPLPTSATATLTLNLTQSSSDNTPQPQPTVPFPLPPLSGTGDPANLLLTLTITSQTTSITGSASLPGNGVPSSLPCGTADFDGDGDSATDADIEAFFACLAGNCCPTCYAGGADFNADGDSATDADIESFFRVLAGGPC